MIINLQLFQIGNEPLCTFRDCFEKNLIMNTRKHCAVEALMFKVLEPAAGNWVTHGRQTRMMWNTLVLYDAVVQWFLEAWMLAFLIGFWSRQWGCFQNIQFWWLTLEKPTKCWIAYLKQFFSSWFSNHIQKSCLEGKKSKSKCFGGDSRFRFLGNPKSMQNYWFGPLSALENSLCFVHANWLWPRLSSFTHGPHYLVYKPTWLRPDWSTC